MKNKRRFKLLSQTTFIYLVFAFIAFYSSALFLTQEADEFINKALEHRFRKSARHITNRIRKGYFFENHSSVFVKPIHSQPDSTLYPQYTDTLIYNSSLDETRQYRKKTVSITVDSRHFLVEILKPLDDFYRLRDDIFGALIPAFILLALSIVFFNYLLSGYFFQPFNKILGIMKTYKVGQGLTIRKVNTRTSEFIRMQELFHQMIARIENEYQNLKEYTENMAHEMQTPLSVIRNKTENLIADEKVMQNQASTVKMIYDETNHLSKLGNTLNLLTKIENGEFNNSLEVQTKPVIETQVNATRELIQLKSLEIETDLSTEHRLLIDPFLLDLLLKNLLRNAIRYGTAEGPIRIATTPEKLSFTNYGPPLDVPGEKLFERFYRSSTRKNALGLGLSLVKKICDLSQLKIEYQYRENQHCFCIHRLN